MSKIFQKGFREYKYSGFGNKTDHQPERLINTDGSVNVEKTGLSFFNHFSVFHFLVTTNWLTFNSLVIFSYVFTNLLFGLIYYFNGIDEIGIRQNRRDHSLKNLRYAVALLKSRPHDLEQPVFFIGRGNQITENGLM